MRKNKFGKNKVAKIRRTLCFAMAVVCAACSLGACGSEDDRHIYPDSTPSTTESVDVPPEPEITIKGYKGEAFEVFTAGPFVGGLAAVSFEQGSQMHNGIIDSKGRLVRSNTDEYKFFSVGNGAILECKAADVTTNKVYRLYDASGELIREFEEDLTFIACGDGKIMVSKSDVSSVYIGFLDSNGNYAHDFKTISKCYEGFYLGEGMFVVSIMGGSYYGGAKDYVVINSSDNSHTIIKRLDNIELWDHKIFMNGYSIDELVEFRNGVAFVSNESCRDYSQATISNDKTNETKSLPKHFVLGVDGSCKEYVLPENCWIVGYKGDYVGYRSNAEPNLLYVDKLSGASSTTIKYNAPAPITSVFFDGDYAAVSLSGVDGIYITVIDNTGKQLLEPVKISHSGAFEFDDGVLLYYDSSAQYRIHNIKTNQNVAANVSNANDGALDLLSEGIISFFSHRKTEFVDVNNNVIIATK